LGQTVPQIRNDITGTSAFFEPALDYVVVKIPRWPYDKFLGLDPAIGTRMRSTGEVMAIGRTVEEAMRKALRSIDTKERVSSANLEKAIATPNSRRLSAILTALRAGWEPARVADVSRIHPWFVERLAKMNEDEDGEYVFKMVDTCAAEFEARTPYFYGTRLPGGRNEATPLPGPKAIILGSGPIRIGQGIEFDYSTVHACHALGEAGVLSIIVNNNPETVSTDYSTSDRLYFEPLDIDAVMAVVENERDGLLGVIPQFGGQTAINLVDALEERGVQILGTSPQAIDAAEDRGKASAVLGARGVPTPAWRSVDRWEDMPAAVEAVGFPALLRPSYVLSGAGMTLVRETDDVQNYLAAHGHTPLARPLLIDQFLDGAVELNVDAVCDGRDVVSVVMEQFEECGVHSGDSAEVYPVQSVSPEVLETIEIYTRIVARAFGTRGLMNVQYAVQGADVYVLEVNPRASRSVPFASKASGIPLADLAIRVILGASLRDLQPPVPRTDRICVKEVVLPFRVFPDLPPVLGPEMQSTGESMGIGRTFGEAYWKAQLGAGLRAMPFGRPVYVSLSTSTDDVSVLVERLTQLECPILTPPSSHTKGIGRYVAPGDVEVGEIGMAIVLGRSPAELTLLRQCVDSGVPYISTPGGLRALCLALGEGKVVLEPMEATSKARSEAAA
jgi:carbamoyl-phosphate synthase large subunit